MSEELQTDLKPGVRLTAIGVAVTVVYLITLAGLAYWKGSSIAALSPNEFGDMLGGSFAPLAFLWLVLGFFQQGHELRQNVIALRLQGEELRNSVEQQRALVEATREQIEFEREALNVQKEEHERLSRPYFRLDTYISNSMKLKRFRVGAENQGADCTSVSMSLFDKEFAVASAREEILMKGKRIVVENAYERSEPIDLNGNYVIMEYVDKRNQIGRQKFVIKAEKGSSIKYVFELID